MHDTTHPLQLLTHSTLRPRLVKLYRYGCLGPKWHDGCNTYGFRLTLSGKYREQSVHRDLHSKDHILTILPLWWRIAKRRNWVADHCLGLKKHLIWTNRLNSIQHNSSLDSFTFHVKSPCSTSFLIPQVQHMYTMHTSILMVSWPDTEVESFKIL